MTETRETEAPETAGRGRTLVPPVGERDHAQGPATAATTLVEYGDYQDARCADVQPWIRAFQDRMGERLHLVFRHFPATGLYPHAAEAAEAAGLQGRFWAMHDTLLDHPSALGNGHIVEYADALDLDMSRFLRDMAGHVSAERLREDQASGARSGVRDTPTFFVNGVRQPGPWDGAASWAMLEKVCAESPDRLREEETRNARYRARHTG